MASRKTTARIVENVSEESSNGLEKEVIEEEFHGDHDDFVDDLPHYGDIGGDTLNPDEWELDDIKPLVVFPDGKEVKAQIVSAQYGDKDKNGSPFLRLMFDPIEHELGQDFQGFFTLPRRSTQTAKQFSRNQKMWSAFLKSFKIDASRGIKVADIIGLEGWVVLGVRKSKLTGEDENFLKRPV